MKKISILLCGLLAAVLFAACGDDDVKGGDGRDYNMSLPKTYDVTYHLSVADMFVMSDLADLVVSYYDAGGTLHEETVNSSEWSNRQVFNVADGLRIGLKAEWRMRPAESRPVTLRDSYNLNIDLMSLYVLTKMNGDVVESAFHSKKNVNTANRFVTTADILSLPADTKFSSSYLYEFAKGSDGAIYSKESDF